MTAAHDQHCPAHQGGTCLGQPTCDHAQGQQAPQAQDTNTSTQGGEGSTELAQSELATKVQCEGTSRKTGERCKAFSVRGERMCAGHLGLGKLDPHRAAEKSAQVRQDAAAARKRAPLDAYKAMLTENAEKYAERLDRIAKGDDDAAALRAIELLNARVLGKPKETIEQTSGRPADLEALQHMTQAERDSLYAELMAAEGLDLDVTQA